MKGKDSHKQCKGMGDKAGSWDYPSLGLGSRDYVEEEEKRWGLFSSSFSYFPAGFTLSWH